MKVIKIQEIGQEELECDNCECLISSKNMWRVFESGRVMEDGNNQSLDFCSAKCSKEWIKKNITTESINTEQVKGYKKDLKGEDLIS